MAKTERTIPESGQLWLSRPPYVLIAYLQAVDAEARPPRIEYALLDDDGSTLTESRARSTTRGGGTSSTGFAPFPVVEARDDGYYQSRPRGPEYGVGTRLEDRGRDRVRTPGMRTAGLRFVSRSGMSPCPT